jgi:hypothetical protein
MQLCSCSFAPPASAEEAERTFFQDPNVLVIEGFLVANSYLASLNPRAFGVFCAIFCPTGGGVSDWSSTSGVVTLASVEALSIYDIGINSDKVSEGEIFKRNLIGWNIVLGINALAEHLTGQTNKGKKMSFGFAPDRNGGTLLLSSKF